MENLNHLTRLVNLNLSNNKIKVITGLKGLNELKNLDLVANFIEDTASCAELMELPKLAALDLSNNLIADHQNILEFFGALPALNALKLKGNPGTRMVSKYRKNMTMIIKKLNYLDDRPVMAVERMTADAFSRGGKEEEERVLVEYREGIALRDKNARLLARTNEAKGKERRKNELQRMFAELRGEKLDLLKKKEELLAEYDRMSADDTGRDHLLSRIRFYEQELKTEFFKILEDKGEEKPTVPVADIPKMINDAHNKRVIEEEERVSQIKRQAAEDVERFMESETAQQARDFEVEQAQREAEYEAREEEYRQQ